jgi:hypothetical protein
MTQVKLTIDANTIEQFLDVQEFIADTYNLNSILNELDQDTVNGWHEVMGKLTFMNDKEYDNTTFLFTESELKQHYIIYDLGIYGSNSTVMIPSNKFDFTYLGAGRTYNTALRDVINQVKSVWCKNLSAMQICEYITTHEMLNPNENLQTHRKFDTTNKAYTLEKFVYVAISFTPKFYGR